MRSGSLVGLLTASTPDHGTFQDTALGSKGGIDEKIFGVELVVIGGVGDGLAQYLRDWVTGSFDGKLELIQSLRGRKTDDRLDHQIDLSGCLGKVRGPGGDYHFFRFY